MKTDGHYFIKQNISNNELNNAQLWGCDPVKLDQNNNK